MVKRFYKPEWGDKWREHFSVDIINGTPGQRIEVRQPQAGHQLPARRLRSRRRLAHVRPAQGFSSGRQRCRWRTTSPRRWWCRDASWKISIRTYRIPSLKFVKNCEHRLFQRPDDAIHRGYDKQTEADFAQPGNFFSNYEPLTASMARGVDRGLHRFRSVHRADAAAHPRRGRDAANRTYFVSSAIRASWTASRRKNPRYLQMRPDLVQSARRLSGGNGRAPAPAHCRSTSPCSPGQRRAARPPQQSARTRRIRSLAVSIRFIIWSCRNCSWNSSAA